MVVAWVLSLGRTSLDLLAISAWILFLPRTEIGEFISDGTVRGKTGQITWSGVDGWIGGLIDWTAVLGWMEGLWVVGFNPLTVGGLS